MKAVDLNVLIPTEKDLPKFCEMAQSLGYSAIASPISQLSNRTVESKLPVYNRINLEARRLSSLKRQATSARANNTIVAIPLLGVDTANWAAEDSRIDILTVDATGNHALRKTTANISAKHGTVLEVCIEALLDFNGLERSRIFRNIHESVSVAIRAGMKIVLSSGAKIPIHMRSPVALRHIGMVLGMNRQLADEAILKNPQEMITQNIERKNGNIVQIGQKTLKGDDK